MNGFQKYWASLTDGQRTAVGAKVGRAKTGDESVAQEVIEAVLRGDLRVVLEDATLLLVDDTGRAIPFPNFNSKYINENKDFYFTQPEVNYGAVYAEASPILSAIGECVTAEQFERDARAIIAEIGDDRQISNLLKRTHLPIFFPRHDIGDNYGEKLKSAYLAAVKTSYLKSFPQREFKNWPAGELDGQVKVVSGTRHERLIEIMRQRSVVGVYFPNPLQGFSIPGDREMIQMFPRQCLLSGAIDTAVAMTIYPQTLARDPNTPTLDCAAVQWQDPGNSLYFGAGDDLVFCDGGLGETDRCTGGVLVLRQSQP